MPERRGLGKGLGALIPSAPAEGASSKSGGPLELALDCIVPNPRQPRQVFHPEALQELADSIRAHGLIQPLIVAPLDGGAEGQGPARYQIIAGERRWQAARIAGLTRVPVVVKDVTPRELLELALVENIQRADLNVLEEAAAFQQLVQEFGLTQEQVAARVGRSRVAVTNAIRLLRLPDAIKDALREDRISEGHARAILGLSDPEDQLAVLRAIEKRALSVRQTEELVRRLASTTEPAPEPKRPSPHTKSLEDAFRNALGTKVALARGQRGGRLVIYFYSDEELQSIYDRIIGEQ